MARVLKQETGVKQVSFDKHKAELSVQYQDKKITVARMIQRVKDMGFVALPGAGKGSYVPPVKFKPSMDFRIISKNGEAVELTKHLAPGKVTVFDFSAKWCGPCKDVEHAMYALLQKHKNLALRKINIVDWDRPVAKQYMSRTGQLPYLIIYDRNGKKVKEIVGRKLKLLRQTIQSLVK